MVVVDVIVCCIFSLYFKLMLTVFQIFNHVLVFFGKSGYQFSVTALG